MRIEQNNKTPLFSFFLRAEEILGVADISRIRKDVEGTLLGYQRGEVRRHVQEIIEFLNTEDVIFPNAIILAISSEVKFKRSRGPQVGGRDCLAGVLEIPVKEPGNRVAWIVDGQQRTMALVQSRKPDLLVPITGFISDDFDVHRSQFLLVNKVKPLPRGLINELLPEVNTALPPSLAKNKVPSAICGILDRDPESPFRCLIVRQTTDRKKEQSAVVADNSLIQVIQTSLNAAHGCLYQYRNVATGNIDVESIRSTLNLYWSEVRRLFPAAWGLPPSQSRLMHGVGIKAMGILMDRIMASIGPSALNAPERVREALSPLEGRCAWTEGQWEQLGGVPWNHLQNTAAHVKLLASALIRTCAGLED